MCTSVFQHFCSLHPQNETVSLFVDLLCLLILFPIYIGSAGSELPVSCRLQMRISFQQMFVLDIFWTLKQWALNISS